MGRFATLAALALILTRLLQAETARAEALGVAQPIAAIAFLLTRLVGERAAAVVDAVLAIEEVLAAVCGALARVLGEVTAGAVLAGARTAAVALPAAGLSRLVTTEIARFATEELLAWFAVRVAALVGGRPATLAQRETHNLLAGAADALAIGPARRAIGPRLLAAHPIRLAADAAITLVILAATVEPRAGGADAVLATVAGGTAIVVGVATGAVSLGLLDASPIG